MHIKEDNNSTGLRPNEVLIGTLFNYVSHCRQ
jgi:hypothetical protein